MWSAEHSISSGDSPRNSGLIYGNFSGSSQPGLPLPPELLPPMIPPINPTTADLTRVSMLVARRGGVSVGRCAAPRLPFPGFPPSSAALGRRKAGRRMRRRRRRMRQSSDGYAFIHSARKQESHPEERMVETAVMLQVKPCTPPWRVIDNSSAVEKAEML